MDTNLIAQIASTGPVGLVAAFLLWERFKSAAERLQADKDHIEAEKALAASLATLAETIRQMAK
jgi:hypothetical protein